MNKINLTYYCKDCGTKIYWSAALYGSGRCKPCADIFNTGKNHPMFGKHHSKESKLKMSKAARGRKFSKETRKN
jgi:hypothetical protein